MQKWRMERYRERYRKAIWFYAFTHVYMYTYIYLYKTPMIMAALGMETAVCVTMGCAQTWEVMHGA